MRLFSGLTKFALALLIMTAIGQMHIGGESLEWKYHRAVNSRRFQRFFWTTVTPVTWTNQKVHDLFAEQRERARDEVRPNAR